jgi:hypothetical protein
MSHNTFTSGSALDLVTYQPGSVVSHEILKKKTGSVTAFAFDANEGLSFTYGTEALADRILAACWGVPPMNVVSRRGRAGPATWYRNEGD